MPGKLLWVYGSGVLVILAGAGRPRAPVGTAGALALGLLVFAWALLRHLPIVAADALLGGSWTRAGKALTFVGGSFAVAAHAAADPGSDRGRLAAFRERDRPVRQVGSESALAAS